MRDSRRARRRRGSRRMGRVRAPRADAAGGRDRARARSWAEPAGGGSVAAVRLAGSPGGVAVLHGARGRRPRATRRSALEALGVRVEAASSPGASASRRDLRRGFGRTDDHGDRSRIAPRLDDPLPLDELEGCDAVYFTGGDAGALRPPPGGPERSSRRHGRSRRSPRRGSSSTRSSGAAGTRSSATGEAISSLRPDSSSAPKAGRGTTLAGGDRGRFRRAAPAGPGRRRLRLWRQLRGRPDVRVWARGYRSTRLSPSPPVAGPRSSPGSGAYDRPARLSPAADPAPNGGGYGRERCGSHVLVLW